MREIKRLVVHCSATSPHMDIGKDEINKWHLMRGFTPTPTSPAIGYHKVIRRNGVIEDGRPEERIGAHAQGYNKDSLAVCLVGGVAADNQTPENNFTPAQFESLKTVLKDWVKRYGNVEICGHRDLPDVHKACPSFDVVTWVRNNL